MRKSLVVLAVIGSLVMACTSSNNGNGGSGGSSGGGAAGGCTVSEGGSVTFCYDWTGLPAGFSDTFCPVGIDAGAGSSTTYASVSSCPGGSVGTCTYTETAGSTTYTYNDTFYGVNGMTCAEAKQACTDANSGGAIKTTFSGGGC
jgi:hypothetical protein